MGLRLQEDLQLQQLVPSRRSAQWTPTTPSTPALGTEDVADIAPTPVADFCASKSPIFRVENADFRGRKSPIFRVFPGRHPTADISADIALTPTPTSRRHRVADDIASRSDSRPIFRVFSADIDARPLGLLPGLCELQLQHQVSPGSSDVGCNCVTVKDCD